MKIKSSWKWHISKMYAWGKCKGMASIFVAIMCCTGLCSAVCDHGSHVSVCSVDVVAIGSHLIF